MTKSFSYEEVWDDLDAVTGTANGLVGGTIGVFVYANTFINMNLSVQTLKVDLYNADNGNPLSSGSSYDFSLTTSSLMDGLDVAFWLWRNS